MTQGIKNLCSICQKDKIPVVLEKCKDKLPEHAKVN